MRASELFQLIVFFVTAANTFGQGPETPARFDSRHDLMPVPVSVKFDSGKLAVDKSFTFSVRGHNDARLQSGVDRMIHRLEGRTVLEFAHAASPDSSQATLVIDAGGPGQLIPSADEDESYSLTVASKQAIL